MAGRKGKRSKRKKKTSARKVKVVHNTRHGRVKVVTPTKKSPHKSTPIKLKEERSNQKDLFLIIIYKYNKR